MSQPRELTFKNEDEIITDVENLRRGHTAVGRWTLPMAAWHVKLALDTCLHQPKSLEPTPEQKGMQKLLAGMTPEKPMPHGLPIAPGTEPPADAGEDAVDGLIAGLKRLQQYTNSHVDFGPFGPVTAEQFRVFIRLHAANHLDFFLPTVARREGLSFNSTEAVKADVNELKHGHTAAGRWSLAQACFHLDKIMASSMKPGPHPADTAEQTARKPVLDRILSTGKIPDGLVSPDEMTPPADTPKSAVDEFFSTLDRFAAFDGPFAPHRLFGRLPDADRRRHQLIHCAHHLSYLVPAKTT